MPNSVTSEMNLSRQSLALILATNVATNKSNPPKTKRNQEIYLLWVGKKQHKIPQTKPQDTSVRTAHLCVLYAVQLCTQYSTTDLINHGHHTSDDV